MKPILIGLTGKARSGKDTAADVLEHLYDFRRYAFAGPLKKGLRAMLGLSIDHTDGYLKEHPIARFNDKSAREMLQTLGTEWGRTHVDENLWVNLGLYEWEKQSAEDRSLVITDVRFDNEAEAIRAAGGIICHITRVTPDCPPINVPGHASEAGVTHLPGDIAIANVGSLDEYIHAVRINFNEVFDNVA